MKSTTRSLFIAFVHCLTLSFFFTMTVNAAEQEKTQTIAVIKTNHGDITLKLFDNKAPKTVKNFVRYANDNFYDNTIFHRVIPNFMIQGGGFDPQLNKKATRSPITNEANPFIANKRGTIAMARTSDPDSATAQFFINVVNNAFLNKSATNAGYAVFGEVTNGLEVADKISGVKTGSRSHMRDVPIQDVMIKSIDINP